MIVMSVVVALLIIALGCITLIVVVALVSEEPLRAPISSMNENDHKSLHNRYKE